MTVMRYLLACGLLALTTTGVVVACATGEVDNEAPIQGGTTDGDTNPSDTSTPVTQLPASAFEQACTDNATSVCLITDRCNPTALATVYGTVSTCIARVKANCLQVVTGTGTGWTPEKMTACAAARNVQTCQQFSFARTPIAECDVRGALDDEAPCRGGAQCKSGYCKVAAGEACGFCVPRARVGAACNNHNDCDGELLCSGTKTCTEPGALATTCGADKPCALGLACIAGACKATLDEGQDCDRATNGNAECDAVKGLYCRADTAVCARIAVVQAGQPCVVPNEEIRCGGNGICVEGVCAAASPDETACGDAGAGVRCSALAMCLDEKCQIPDPARCR